MAARWWQTGLVVLGGLVCLNLLQNGVSAGLFFLLAMGLIFPLAVSIRLHQLTESGLVLIPLEYLGSQSAQDGSRQARFRRSLTNPCFFSPDRARQFFASALSVRLALQVGIMAMLLVQSRMLTPSLALLSVGLGAGWLLYGMVRSCVSLYAVLNRSWSVEQLVSDSQSEWYRAYLWWQNARMPALDTLLGLS